MFQIASSTQEWVRGASTLPKILGQRGVKKPLFWNDLHQPVGPGNHPVQFSDSLGVLMAISRKFDWRKHWDEQDPDHTEWLWENLQDYWELDDEILERKEYTLGVLSSSIFRSKKSKWKQVNYSRFTTYEERILHPPQQLSQQEWVNLVKFWDTPEQQIIAARNKANRAKQIVKHTTGRTSFPQLREKYIQEEGAPPYQGEFFVISHTSQKTNGPLDECSREYIEQMKEKAGRDENGQQQPLTDEVYTEVMPKERYGRVRMMGRGVTQTSIGRSSRSSAVSSTRMAELENEMAEMKRQADEKEEERQREFDDMRKQLQEKEDDRQRELEEIRRQTQEREDERQCEMEAMKQALEQRYNVIEARLMQFLETRTQPKRLTKSKRG
ncbi:hypothetical protein ACHQM5_012103 [Ranunculus cassubicifolius]